MDQRNNRPELRNKLFMLLKERAFRRGKIVLASGRESDFYFDMKPAMLDPDGAALLAELILQELEGVQADCVGGLEMGAVPLIAPVAMKSPEYRPAPSGLLRAQGGEGPRHQEARRWHRHRRQVRGDPGGRDHHGRIGDGRGQGRHRSRRQGRARARRSSIGARAPPTSMRQPASRSNRCSAPRSSSRS